MEELKWPGYYQGLIGKLIISNDKDDNNIANNNKPHTMLSALLALSHQLAGTPIAPTSQWEKWGLAVKERTQIHTR